MHAPAHLDLEVVSAFRNLVRPRPQLLPAVSGALRHLAGFPIRRATLAPMVDRIWELRDNITAYDAAYVVLAERLGVRVITCDSRLAAAAGERCEFELIV